MELILSARLVNRRLRWACFSQVLGFTLDHAVDVVHILENHSTIGKTSKKLRLLSVVILGKGGETMLRMVLKLKTGDTQIIDDKSIPDFDAIKELTDSFLYGDPKSEYESVTLTKV